MEKGKWRSSVLKRHLRKWRNFMYIRSIAKQARNTADIQLVLQGAAMKKARMNRNCTSLRSAFCYWVVSSRRMRKSRRLLFRRWRVRTGIAIAEKVADRRDARKAFAIWKRRANWPRVIAFSASCGCARGMKRWLLLHLRLQSSLGASLTGRLHADQRMCRRGMIALKLYFKQRVTDRIETTNFSHRGRILCKQHFRDWSRRWRQCCQHRKHYYEAMGHYSARNCQRLLRHWQGIKAPTSHRGCSYVQGLWRRADRHRCRRHLRLLLRRARMAEMEGDDRRRAQWWFHRRCLLRWLRAVGVWVAAWCCEQAAVRQYRTTLVRRYFYGVWLRRKDRSAAADMRSEAATAVVLRLRARRALKAWVRWLRPRAEIRHLVVYVQKRLATRRWRRWTRVSGWANGIALRRAEMRYTVRSASMGLARWHRFIRREKVLSVCLGTFHRLQVWRVTKRIFHAWRRHFTPYMKRLHMADSFVSSRTESRLLYGSMIQQWRQAWNVRRSQRHFGGVVVRRWNRRHRALKEWWQGQQERVLGNVSNFQPTTGHGIASFNCGRNGARLSSLVLRAPSYIKFINLALKRRVLWKWRANKRAGIEARLLAERIRHDQVELIGYYAACSTQVEQRTALRAMTRALDAMKRVVAVRREAIWKVMMRHSGRRWFAAWRMARKEHYVYRMLPTFPAKSNGLPLPLSTRGSSHSNPVLSTIQRNIDSSRLGSGDSSVESSPGSDEDIYRSSQILCGYRQPQVFHTPLRKVLRDSAAPSSDPVRGAMADISNIRMHGDASLLLSPHHVDVSLGTAMNPLGRSPAPAAASRPTGAPPAPPFTPTILGVPRSPTSLPSSTGRRGERGVTPVRYGSVMVDPTASSYSSTFRIRAKYSQSPVTARKTGGPTTLTPTPTAVRQPNPTTSGSVGAAQAREWEHVHDHDHAVHMQRLKNLYARCQNR